MALRKLVTLCGLQLRYLATTLRSPGHARYFWSELFHAATVTHRSLAAAEKHGLPSATAEEVLPGISQTPFSVVDFRQEYGGVSYAEARLLAASIQLLQPTSLFELGTFNGATTRLLVLNALPDARVTTIDLPPEHSLRKDRATVDVSPQEVGALYRGTAEEQRIDQLYGNTLEFDFSPYDRSVDWIFIDAAHTYEAVLSDSRNALRMIRPGGIIFWHDVSLKFEGNCLALSQISETAPIHHLAGTSLAVHRAAGSATRETARA